MYIDLMLCSLNVATDNAFEKRVLLLIQRGICAVAMLMKERLEH
jgi:hypothetical protein